MSETHTYKNTHTHTQRGPLTTYTRCRPGSGSFAPRHAPAPPLYHRLTRRCAGTAAEQRPAAPKWALRRLSSSTEPRELDCKENGI